MNEQSTLRSQITTLKILSLAPAVALLGFCVVVYFLNSDRESSSGDMFRIFQIAVPLTLVVCLAAGYFVFANAMKKIDSTLPLKNKIAKYQQAFIVRMGILEIPGIVGGVAAFLTANLYFLGAPALIIIIFVLFRPSLFAIAEDLSLSQEEKLELQNKHHRQFDK